jgi:hypothetical protein
MQLSILQLLQFVRSNASCSYAGPLCCCWHTLLLLLLLAPSVHLANAALNLAAFALCGLPPAAVLAHSAAAAAAGPHLYVWHDVALLGAAHVIADHIHHLITQLAELVTAAAVAAAARAQMRGLKRHTSACGPCGVRTWEVRQCIQQGASFCSLL